MKYDSHGTRMRLKNQLNWNKIGNFDMVRIQRYCPLDFELITGQNRITNIKIYRQVVHALLFASGYGYSEIGRLLNRDHVTIMHSVKTVSNMIQIHDMQYIKAIWELSKDSEYYTGEYEEKINNFVISQIILQKRFESMKVN
jgi:chromosomal replication initiation ATPase DnaA